MKKIFMMLIIMFIIYLGIQFGFRFFGNGHEYEYLLSTETIDFRIREKFINNTKNETDSYYFHITVNDTVFSFQTYESFNKANHIIKEVVYYDGKNYKCILPIFVDNKIIGDVKCLKNNMMYNYNDIEGTDHNLDLFVSTLAEYGYDKNKFKDVAVSTSVNGIEFYKENAVKKHFLALSTYKGIYTLNDINSYKLKEIELFKNDIYKKPISIVFKNYYVVADYNSKYRFDKFYVVDLTSNKVDELDCDREISFDSYIQGTNNNSIYLFDKDSKKQYEINLKTNKVLEVGNENTQIKIYKDGDWSKVSATSAKNDVILFDDDYKSDIDASGFDRVDKVGGNNSGYYYFYQKQGSEYKVYRSPVLNYTQLTYLFNTTDISRINYYKDYVYYVYGTEIRYFNDNIGVRTLIKNKELSFNENLIFGLYVK